MHVVRKRAHDLQQIELASQHCVQFHAGQQQRETAIATYRQSRVSLAGVILKIRDWLAAKTWRNEWEISPTSNPHPLAERCRYQAEMLLRDSPDCIWTWRGFICSETGIWMSRMPSCSRQLSLSTFKPLGNVIAV